MFCGNSKRLQNLQIAHKGTIKRIKSNSKYVFKKKGSLFYLINDKHHANSLPAKTIVF